jgi:hypothetical protein
MNGASTNPSQRPKVVFWYHVYCIGFAVFALLLGIAGAALWAIDSQILGMDPRNAREEGAVCLAIGVVVFSLYAVVPFLPRSRGAWIYGIVLLAMGLTSICSIAFCIPLLIGWLKPETKAFFGAS